jgi:hypothetical protein
VVRILTRVKQQRGVPKLSFCDNRKRVHQVKRREGSTYPSTDDCDCRGWFFPCSHVSTLGRSLHQRNSQILMPYKQGPDIDSKSSLLIRHHFFYLDGYRKGEAP